MTRPGRLAGCMGAVLGPGVLLGGVLAISGPAPGVASVPPDTHRMATSCTAPGDGFRPAAMSIDGVLARTRVLARAEDRYGVPRPPPLTERGKWQLAWDRVAGVMPGDARGVARLTAHTYPRDGSHGSALGNLLLARLRTGARLVVSGVGAERLCYRVTRRQQVRATASLSGYYDTTGPPRLAILVCSGTRRGPGDWSHRTIWYAAPVAPPRS